MGMFDALCTVAALCTGTIAPLAPLAPLTPLSILLSSDLIEGSVIFVFAEFIAGVVTLLYLFISTTQPCWQLHLIYIYT